MNSGPRITTKHAELTLEQIADALPGTGELMRSVGHCFAMTWHAAHGGNWDLAAYYLRRTRSLLRGLAITRPKYAAQVREFEGGLLEDAYQALLAHNLAAFDDRFQASTERANDYHVETGHPYIRWKLPAQPPDGGVDLNA